MLRISQTFNPQGQINIYGHASFETRGSLPKSCRLKLRNCRRYFRTSCQHNLEDDPSNRTSNDIIPNGSWARSQLLRTSGRRTRELGLEQVLALLHDFFSRTSPGLSWLYSKFEISHATGRRVISAAYLPKPTLSGPALSHLYVISRSSRLSRWYSFCS